MTAQDTFKQLLAEELRPHFKARGFRQKPSLFSFVISVHPKRCHPF